MSSILDALKKLDQDKADAETDDILAEGELTAKDAERDLLGRQSSPEQWAIRVTPWTIILAVAALVVLVSVPLLVVLLVNRGPAPQLSQVANAGPSASPQAGVEGPVEASPAAPAAVAQPAPQQVASEKAVAVRESLKPAVIAKPPTPAREAASPPATPTAPPQESAVSAPPAVPVTVPSAPATPSPPIQLARKTPSIDSDSQTAPTPARDRRTPRTRPAEEPEPATEQPKNPLRPVAPESEGARSAPKREPAQDSTDAAQSAASSSPVEAADVSTYPVLTETQRTRIGLPEMKINFVGMPSKSVPRPRALINMQKVYVGETIPGTNAILIGVSMTGIGIEVGGQRFFVPN